jgi:DNA-binding PadR family transcriptional regulator
MRGSFNSERGMRGGGRRRMFDGGELRLVLLHLMESQPRYGYDLIRDIEARTAGAYVPSPGIIYPTLTLLEELEHIRQAEPAANQGDGGKRAFILTERGKMFLDERRTELGTTLSRLDAIRAAASQTETGPVWRAMQNLKAVLQQRLTGPADKELLFQAAECIDEAARKIERLP